MADNALVKASPREVDVAKITGSYVAVGRTSRHGLLFGLGTLAIGFGLPDSIDEQGHRN